MKDEKLIAKRGEEPALLPGQHQETWRRVDFGLGAAATPVDTRLGRKVTYPSKPIVKIGKIIIAVFLIIMAISVASSIVLNFVF